MPIVRLTAYAVMLFLAAAVARAEDPPGGPSGGPSGDPSDDIVQYATITGLLQGLYDGDLTIGALRRFGDLGLGTFNHLDGEMVQLDGDVYQVTGDGRVHTVPDTTKTPFAVVTHFDVDRQSPLPPGLSYAQLQAHLDDLIANPNYFQAIRIDGVFSSMKVRSVPAQTPPYRPLVDVVKDHQGVFQLTDVAGTLVGFRTPQYMAGLNVPGYHVHFLSADHQHGGHVLDLTTTQGHIAIDESATFRMLLPETEAFANANISDHDAEALEAVEKAK
jgi:acetolactate decarboxylase